MIDLEDRCWPSACRPWRATAPRLAPCDGYHGTMTKASPNEPGVPLLAVHGQRATLTLNRPAHHNRLQVEDLLTLQRH